MARLSEAGAAPDAAFDPRREEHDAAFNQGVVSVMSEDLGEPDYWPLLDTDLSVTSIRGPSAFPLVSKAQG